MYKLSQHIKGLVPTLLLLLLFSSGSSHAQQVREYATFDSLKVGDLFYYSIALNRSDTYDDIIFPDSTHFGENFEIRDRRRFKLTDFKDSLAFRLQFFGTADSRIEPLPVRLVNGPDTTTLFTNPVPVYFSPVVRSEQQEFRPLKPIFDFARSWWPYLLLLILLGIGGWYFYRWYMKKQDQEKPAPKKKFQPEAFINPLKVLSDRLKELKSFTFEEEEDYKLFYINLGDAIRDYFEQLYRIPALELTSREIIHELNRRAVDDDLVEQTRAVLNEADMVKFAKFTPTPDQARNALKKGEEFLKRARKIDGKRIDHLRRKHNARVEKQRIHQQLQQEERDEENEDRTMVEEQI